MDEIIKEYGIYLFALLVVIAMWICGWILINIMKDTILDKEKTDGD